MYCSDLNEDKICQMFQDSNYSQKRQQISLNYTVTSRESRRIINTNQQERNIKYMQNYSKNNVYNKNLITQASLADNICLALNQLDRFNYWFQNLSDNNQKLIDDLSNINNYVEINRPTELTLPNLNYLKKRLNKPVRNLSLEFQQAKIQCIQCKKHVQIIQTIQQQYHSKIDQCKLYYDKIQQLQKQLLHEIEKQLKNTLIQCVQINLLKQQNQNLNSQIVNLKLQLDKFKIQKSMLLQKSTSLLKTKNLLKGLQPNSTNPNLKLFSNGKNSTKALTMNKIQYINQFDDIQQNLKQIKFYNEESQNKSAKMKQSVLQKDKKVAFNFGNQISSEINCKKCQNKEKKVNQNLINRRQKNSEEIQNNSKLLQDNESLRKLVKILQRQIIGLQNQKNNLLQTNTALIETYISNRKTNSAGFHQQQTNKIMQQLERMHNRQKYLANQRRKLQLQLQQIKESVRVYCRIRPKIGIQMKHRSVVTYRQDTKIIKDGKEFQFDYIFNGKNSQKQIYQEIKPLVEKAYDKRNLCIFSHGETGSGKTYTMQGNQKNLGITPHIIYDLYCLAEKDKNAYDVSFSMSIIKIYKEQIQDVFSFGKKFEIKQKQNSQIILDGSTIIKFQNRQQMLKIYHNFVTKTTTDTQSNSQNKKYHTIVTIYIEKLSKNTKKQSNLNKFTKIALIDLASGQMLNSSNPSIQKQNQPINKSLSYLFSVLYALKNKNQYIPYKESKLTHIMKQYFSNKSNILMLINISQSELKSKQTDNTLAFGICAKSISRNSTLNIKDSNQRILKETKENKQIERNRRTSSRLSMG